MKKSLLFVPLVCFMMGCAPTQTPKATNTDERFKNGGGPYFFYNSTNTDGNCKEFVDVSSQSAISTEHCDFIFFDTKSDPSVNVNRHVVFKVTLNIASNLIPRRKLLLVAGSSIPTTLYQANQCDKYSCLGSTLLFETQLMTKEDDKLCLSISSSQTSYSEYDSKSNNYSAIYKCKLDQKNLQTLLTSNATNKITALLVATDSAGNPISEVTRRTFDVSTSYSPPNFNQIVYSSSRDMNLLFYLNLETGFSNNPKNTNIYTANNLNDFDGNFNKAFRNESDMKLSLNIEADKSLAKSFFDSDGNAVLIDGQLGTSTSNDYSNVAEGIVAWIDQFCVAHNKIVNSLSATDSIKDRVSFNKGNTLYNYQNKIGVAAINGMKRYVYDKDLNKYVVKDMPISNKDADIIRKESCTQLEFANPKLNRNGVTYISADKNLQNVVCVVYRCSIRDAAGFANTFADNVELGTLFHELGHAWSGGQTNDFSQLAIDAQHNAYAKGEASDVCLMRYNNSTGVTPEYMKKRAQFMEFSEMIRQRMMNINSCSPRDKR